MKVGNVSQTVLKTFCTETTAYKKKRDSDRPFGGRDVYCGTDQGHRRCGLCFGCSFWKFQKISGVYAIMRAVLDLETRGGFGNWCFGTGDSANICL